MTSFLGHMLKAIDPWRQITGLRHKLIHDYFEVDIDVVWTTATVNVPAVEPKLRWLAERLGGLE